MLISNFLLYSKQSIRKYNHKKTSNFLLNCVYRILFMNEVLQGMKVLKLYAWEKPFINKINEYRQDTL